MEALRRLLAVSLITLTACTVSSGASTTSSADRAVGCSSGGQKSVPLKVATGPSGSILAFVPVSVDGKGPFPFTLDTGAAQSLISARLAQQLHLHVVGKTRAPVMGITGGARAEIVSVPSWKVGQTSLPSHEVFSLAIQPHQGPLGLLGSDVLSRFRSIEVDYANGQLTLCA